MRWLTLVEDYTGETAQVFWLRPHGKTLDILLDGDPDGATLQLRTRAPGLPGGVDAKQLKWYRDDGADWVTLGSTDRAGLHFFDGLPPITIEVIVAGMGASADFSLYARGGSFAREAT